MIFYASALSSYSAKVRLVLCVKGVAFEERPPPNGYRSPEYRAIVPMGTLPAIQIGDFVLSESEAINEYLEETHPEPPMMPQGLRERAKVRFISRFHDLHLEPKVRALFPHARPARRDETVVSALHAEISQSLQRLDAMCEPQPWLLTPSISLADCGLLVSIPLAQQILQACGQPLILPTRLATWLENSASDAAVERALAPWRKATQTWLEA